MATATTPPTREQVFCHECQEVWYRSEHGLVCPNEQCRSDFVEIIEDNNDPRTMPELGDFDEEDSDDEEDRGHPHHFHNHRPPFPPFEAQPALPGGTAFFRAEGPGYSYFTARTTVFPRPASGRGGQEEEVIADLFSRMLRNIVGDQLAGQTWHPPGGGSQNNEEQAREGREGQPHPNPPLFRARLNPRNAEAPQAGEAPPVPDINTFLASLFGTPAADGEVPPVLARLLGVPAGAGGDYVYSQAELDRIISQLMEQHQGNAPPPAAKEDIDALPRVKVTDAMARDGVDCAVCKDDLVLDEQVTMLPCKHTYHFECISKWLEAHDTCPICRQPITPEDRRRQRPQPHPQQTASSGGSGSGGGSGFGIPFLDLFSGGISRGPPQSPYGTNRDAHHPPASNTGSGGDDHNQNESQFGSGAGNEAPHGRFPTGNEGNHSSQNQDQAHDHPHDHSYDPSGSGHRSAFSNLFRRRGS